MAANEDVMTTFLTDGYTVPLACEWKLCTSDSTYRALLDRLQDASCSDDSRVNQVLGLVSQLLKVSTPKRTYFLDIGDVEVERASSVKHSFEWRV